MSSAASPLRIGQVLKGVKDVYVVAQKLHDQVWSARSIQSCTASSAAIVLKYAPETRLQREKAILQHFEGDPYIRQLIDHGKEPSFLVLEHLDFDALRSSREAELARKDIKVIARSVLSALKSLHAKGIAHTDIKPDNILLNFDSEGSRVVEAKLGDCGDAWDVGFDSNPQGTRHAIGAAIFRSPEALFGLKWSTPTDIWSFGATASCKCLISLIWGRNFHIFKPRDMSADDEEFLVHVLVQQARYFGPFPLSYEMWLDKEQQQVLAAVHIHIEEQDMRKRFAQMEDEEMTLEDRNFLCGIMKLDPRDRPTAEELLKSNWFDLP
ncbi:uncharacterized protein MYCGRDRAFT_37854 [Zymoseptoria tritici IPO323]|uniref:Protein kinase domain-containing protein n=1 Tax=Zymoseptoria tritici (strain CBS 115943 / IPO323) TaxID=336722 RepID=F9X5Y5_ZYMTI|nr:uncharacterized protein MYCGRDRAFT_37854 [Zymoseptoria tritici IPO323]EGP89626.1 hypothetical protein MYCGRDRAFT_37854 [Zymoseptoria tritici IPO323]